MPPSRGTTPKSIIISCTDRGLPELSPEPNPTPKTRPRHSSKWLNPRHEEEITNLAWHNADLANRALGFVGSRPNQDINRV
jgi:transposase